MSLLQLRAKGWQKHCSRQSSMSRRGTVSGRCKESHSRKTSVVYGYRKVAGSELSEGESGSPVTTVSGETPSLPRGEAWLPVEIEKSPPNNRLELTDARHYPFKVFMPFSSFDPSPTLRQEEKGPFLFSDSAGAYTLIVKEVS
jgi:hypothetical protein